MINKQEVPLYKPSKTNNHVTVESKEKQQILKKSIKKRKSVKSTNGMMSQKIDRSKIWPNYDQHVNMQIQQKNVSFEKLV